MEEEDVLQQLRAETSGRLAQWAREHNVPHSVVSEVLRGQRGLSPQILDAMGLEKEKATYRKKAAATVR